MEMTLHENMLAILHGEQPEVYGDFNWATKTIMDPITISDSVPGDGLEHTDSWGTVCIKPVGAPGKHPHITPENAVVKDITKWKQQLVIPDYKQMDWTKAEEAAAAVDTNQYFVELLCATGLFERSHFLMGMEDAFCAYLEEPDAMFEMLSAIAEYKKAIIKEAAFHLHPEVIFYHDDWGSKQNLFLPPDVWREMIKPLQREIAQTIHECGMLYMHHSDCICEPIVEDMAEIGIEIWQGVIPQNDIVSIQKRLAGSMALDGGIDSPEIDADDTPREAMTAEVMRCIDTYCPAGTFFPATPAHLLRKKNDDFVQEEIMRYGTIWAAAHPFG